MIKDCKLIPDERGWLMEILRRDDPAMAQGFGQVYATCCYPGVVKGWHKHRKQIDRMACVSGMARVVLADASYRDGCVPGHPPKFEEHIIGPLNPTVVVIPPGIWHAFTAVGPDPCVIINTPSEMYDYEDPDEQKMPLHTFSFPWRELGR